MGFKSVYRVLQELFPEVDARLLKAAAIEHSEDPDGAVEFILTEVIPSTKKQLNTSISGSLNIGSSVESQKQCFSACGSTSNHEPTSAGGAATGSKCMNPLLHCRLDSTLYDAKVMDDQLSGNTESSEVTLSNEETGHKAVQDVSICNISVSPAFLEIQNGHSNQESQNSGFGEACTLEKHHTMDFEVAAHSALSGPATLEEAFLNDSLEKKVANVDSDFCALSSDSAVAVPTESQKTQPLCYGDSSYGSNYVELSSLSAKEHVLESLDCSTRSDVQDGTSTSKFKDSEFSCIPEAALKEDTQAPHEPSIEGSFSGQAILAQSGKVCSTDLLENVIEESKSHKKKLLSDTESILKLMREVEYQEKVVEQAKKKAISNGLVLDANLDELKSTLDRARENNDKFSGEVQGERAILATEMRELQSRLVALSGVKEKSVAILDEIRKGLEARLSAVKMEGLAAEPEKYQREETLQRALAEQELIREKVAQESMILHQEAEENAKLREFLLDRGRVVDALQGEISVICQDVKLLKEKFDNGISLSQSLSASGSARARSEPEQAFERANSPASSIEPTLVPVAVQLKTTEQKEILEEGWELFESAV